MVLKPDLKKDVVKKIREEAVHILGGLMVLRVELMFEMAVKMPEGLHEFEGELNRAVSRKTKRITKLSLIRKTGSRRVGELLRESNARFDLLLGASNRDVSDIEERRYKTNEVLHGIDDPDYLEDIYDAHLNIEQVANEQSFLQLDVIDDNFMEISELILEILQMSKQKKVPGLSSLSSNLREIIQSNILQQPVSLAYPINDAKKEETLNIFKFHAHVSYPDQLQLLD